MTEIINESRRAAALQSLRCLALTLSAALLLYAAPLSASAAAPPLRSLISFEHELDQGLEWLAADDGLAAQRFRLDQVRAESGWKLVGSARAGSYREPIDESRTRNYEALGLRLGIRHPLWGTRTRELEAQHEDEAQLIEAQLETARLQRAMLRELRLAYIDSWSAGLALKLNNAFSESEPEVMRILRLRRQKGRLLESDRLEFASMYRQSERDRVRLRKQQRASGQILALLSNTSATPFVASYPESLNIRPNITAIEQAIDEHPRVALAKAVRDRHQARTQIPASYHLASGIGLYQDFTQEFPGGLGSGTLLALDLEIPLNLRQATRATRGQRNRLASQAERRYRRTQQQVRDHLATALDELSISQRQRDFGRSRQSAAREELRMRYLQAGLLGGDVLEKLQQGLFNYYRAALDRINDEAEVLRQQVLLLEEAPGCQASKSGATPDDNAPLPMLETDLFNPEQFAFLAAGPQRTDLQRVAQDLFGPPAPAVAPRSGRLLPQGAELGTYLWNAEALLACAAASDAHRAGAEWAQTLNLDRLLISFTTAQVRQLQTEPALKMALSEALRGVAEQHISLELLLGDPVWILPAGRSSLLELLELLRFLPVSGLHLDLEPEQLTEGDAASRHKQLAETLRQVVAVSPWPVSLSLHPRSMSQPVDGQPFGAVLSDLNLAYVALMIYIGDPERVADKARPILNAYPGLHIKIAQSVEPPAVLAAAASYAAGGRSAFSRAMQELNVELLAFANYDGLLIQNFAFLQDLKP